MGTGQEARGAGKEPDFVAMAFDDRRLARGEDVVAAADRRDAGFAEELHRPQEGAVAAVHGVIVGDRHDVERSEEHTSELQSLMRISYAVFCLKKKNNKKN